MAKPLLCPCGKWYEPKQFWQHVGCRRDVTFHGEQKAINTDPEKPKKSANGRSIQAYNAYMRTYMAERRRRQKMKGAA